MNAVAKRAGLRVTYRVFATWSETLAALERGDIDLIPVVVITPARESRLLFTRPFLMSPMSVFVRWDAEVEGVADLAGRRVGVIKGGPVPELFGEGEKRPVLVPYPRLQDETFALLLGEVDAISPFEDSAWKLAERAQVADRIKVVGEPLTRQSAQWRCGDLPGLRDRLDAAVADLLDSAEYQSIFAAWHAAPPSFWTPTRMTWIAGASTALLLLGMLCWQFLSLRAEGRQLADSAPKRLPARRVPAGFPTHIVSRACGLIALALGVAVLFGWALDVTALKSVLSGLFAMQPWAAITIALAGGALLLATIPGRIATTACIVLTGAFLIIGVQMLLQHATGADFDADRWFFPEAVGNQLSHPHPGRVAEVTSIAFVLLGAMLLLAHARRAWARGIVGGGQRRPGGRRVGVGAASA
jgi:hypothetical protein